MMIGLCNNLDGGNNGTMNRNRNKAFPSNNNIDCGPLLIGEMAELGMGRHIGYQSKP